MIINNINEELVESLAEACHDQWQHWSTAIHLSEKLSAKRIRRWKKECWKPYEELSEDMKEFDRLYARRIIKVLRKHALSDKQKREEDGMKVCRTCATNGANKS